MSHESTNKQNRWRLDVSPDVYCSQFIFIVDTKTNDCVGTFQYSDLTLNKLKLIISQANAYDNLYEKTEELQRKEDDYLRQIDQLQNELAYSYSSTTNLEKDVEHWRNSSRERWQIIKELKEQNTQLQAEVDRLKKELEEKNAPVVVHYHMTAEGGGATVNVFTRDMDERTIQDLIKASQKQ